eukprot:gene9089-biopygen7669
MQELVKGRILKARFLGDRGVWILLAVYAPQSTDTAALQQFWQAINKEALRRTMEQYGLLDLGPQERTYIHTKHATQGTLSSSRIDLVLGSATSDLLIKMGKGGVEELPWTTSHKDITMEINPRARFTLLDQQLDVRANTWNDLTGTQGLPKEHAALEMWADMWLHTVHFSGLQVRAGQAGTKGNAHRSEGDQDHVHTWGFKYGDRKRFWETVQRAEKGQQGRAGLVIQDQRATVHYEPEKVKDILQEYFQDRFTHPKENDPEWTDKWYGLGGTRDKIHQTLSTGEKVDPH